MSGATVTAAEIAAATGISVRAVNKRAGHAGWPFQIVPVRGGQRWEYVLEFLPESVRMALMNLQTQETLPKIYDHNQAPIAAIQEDGGLAKWYGLPATCREEARMRLGLVNKARSIKARTPKGKTLALKRYAQSQNVSPGTLYRYLLSADQALKRAQAAGEDVIMAQIRALTPDYGTNLGQSRAFDRPAIDYARNIFAAQTHLNLTDVFQLTANEAAIRGWKVGSCDTLKRILDKELNKCMQTLARKGARRYQADCELKILRDYREIWPNFMWCGDHHIFDVFVKMPGGKVLRPWLTAWMDMASRSFMGWCISFQPNSQTIALALEHAISAKDDKNFPQHGLPWSVYIDNGKDYRCKYLNGENIEIGKIDYPEIIEQFAALGIDPFYIDLEYDPTQRAWAKKRGSLKLAVKSIRVGGVYARLGIHQRYATAYHPWAKPIERAFRNVVQQFSRKMPGWCGSGHAQRPEKLPFELKRGLILDYETFCRAFYDWVVYDYHRAAHTGHGMDGRSPNEVFSAYGDPVRVEPALLTFALLKKENVKIHNWGFNLLGREFELDVPANLSGAAILNQAINRFAVVYHDTELKSVRVYVDGKYICNGRRLQRASFMRPDDPVMVDKLRLQAYQRQLNTAALQHVRSAAPDESASESAAILQLTCTAPDRDSCETVDQADPQTDNKHQQLKHTGQLIPLTAEEQYRVILRKIAHGSELAPPEMQFKAEYEQSNEYRAMEQIYRAELEYMQYQQGAINE